MVQGTNIPRFDLQRKRELVHCLMVSIVTKSVSAAHAAAAIIRTVQYFHTLEHQSQVELDLSGWILLGADDPEACALHLIVYARELVSVEDIEHGGLEFQSASLLKQG